MVLFTLFVICAKIIMFSEESFKWNHNWMVSLQTKTKKPALLYSGPFSFRCQINKISRILRKDVVMSFVPLNFNFSNPPTPVWISSLFAVFVTTFGQILDQSIFTKIFGLVLKLVLVIKAMLVLLFWMQPLYSQCFCHCISQIFKNTTNISTVWNETMPKIQKVVSCKKTIQN